MRIVIIGNSATAVGAIESLRQYDQSAEILVISEEPHLIYSRPLLSHYLGDRDRQVTAGLSAEQLLHAPQRATYPQYSCHGHQHGRAHRAG